MRLALWDRPSLDSHCLFLAAVTGTGLAFTFPSNGSPSSVYQCGENNSMMERLPHISQNVAVMVGFLTFSSCVKMMANP